jgi:ribonuclease HI
MSSRKLWHYFEAHHTRVWTYQVLHNIFHIRDSSRQIGKWATKLSEYIINFERRSAIKLQILVDFVAKWMEHQSQVDIVQESPLLVYCDGAWGSTGAGVATILTSPSGIKLCYTTRLQFTSETDKCTNKIVEYKAIMLGLQKLRAISIQTCVLRSDSKVVSGQIEKECIAREPTLERYLALVRRMVSYFKGFTVEFIECNKNDEANDVVKVAAYNTLMSADVFFQAIEDASVKTFLSEPRVINIIEGEDWRAPIMAYLHHYYEPYSKNEHIRMKHRAKDYQIVSNELYRTSVSGLLLRCISKIEG